MSKSRVALIWGEDRYRNIRRALAAIGEDMELAGKRRVLLKPNFVSVHKPLAATHVDAMRAVLDELRARGVENITLGEGPASGELQRGLENYGYLPLIEEYGLRVVDLNRDEGLEVEVWDRQLKPLRVRVARTVIESDYRISVGPPKTHDTVIVTLSLKNYAVGSLTSGHKGRIHQGYAAINLNLCKLAPLVAPHLAVLDGYRAMEGNGPNNGRAVDWRLAVASTDFVAADTVTCRLMGFDPDQVGYLYYCRLKGYGQGDMEAIEIVGNASLEQLQRKFQPHSSYQRQLAWRIPHPERYL